MGYLLVKKTKDFSEVEAELTADLEMGEPALTGEATNGGWMGAEDAGNFVRVLLPIPASG